MTRPIELRVVELLAARLCHDLIGPVSAINNGVELLADEDSSFIREAVGLVGDSAQTASRRLQFYRFTYGFSGTGVAGGSAPHQLATDFFAGSNVECVYGPAMQAAELPHQKLGCAMLAVGADGLPRGGKLALAPTDAGIEVAASGTGPGLSPEARAALALATPVAELTSRTVGAYFAALLADRLGWRLAVEDRPGGFRLLTPPQ